LRKRQIYSFIGIAGITIGIYYVTNHLASFLTRYLFDYKIGTSIESISSDTFAHIIAIILTVIPCLVFTKYVFLKLGLRRSMKNSGYDYLDPDYKDEDKPEE